MTRLESGRPSAAADTIRTRLRTATLGLAVCVLAMFGRQAAADPAPRGKLVITGSSTIAPLIGEIGKRFEKRHPEVRVDVQTGGSSRGIADVRQKLADIGMVSRALGPDEDDLHVFQIARDGVCIILHKSNPLSELSDKQVVAVYTGRIHNWRALGGVDAPITVVNKAQGRATLEVFLHYFGLKSADIRADVIIGDNEQGIKTVAGNPDAIGYVSIGTAEFDAGAGVAIKLCATRGVSATSAHLADGSFPISRPLNLVTSAEPTGWAKTFIAFVRSPEVHDIIKELRFVPLR